MNEDIKPLVEYINTELEKGTPEASLKAAILKQGWSEEKYNLAMTQASLLKWPNRLSKTLIWSYVFWPFFAFGSAFIFDDPSSEGSMWAHLLFRSIWIYPVIAIISYLVSKSIKSTSSKISFWISAVPILFIIIMIIIFSPVMIKSNMEDAKNALEQEKASQVYYEKEDLLARSLYSELKTKFVTDSNIFWDGDKTFLEVNTEDGMYFDRLGKKISLTRFYTGMGSKMSIPDNMSVIGVLVKGNASGTDVAEETVVIHEGYYSQPDYLKKIKNFKGQYILDVYKLGGIDTKRY